MTNDRVARSIELDQELYSDKIVTRFRLLFPAYREIIIPMENYKYLRKSIAGDKRIDTTRYREIIGSLIFNQYMQKPAEHHDNVTGLIFWCCTVCARTSGMNKKIHIPKSGPHRSIPQVDSLLWSWWWVFLQEKMMAECYAWVLEVAASRRRRRKARTRPWKDSRRQLKANSSPVKPIAEESRRLSKLSKAFRKRKFPL